MTIQRSQVVIQVVIHNARDS